MHLTNHHRNSHEKVTLLKSPGTKSVGPEAEQRLSAVGMDTNTVVDPVSPAYLGDQLNISGRPVILQEPFFA